MLSDLRACVFDAYGTLFDVSAAARGLRGEIGPEWERLAALWRSKQVEYTWLRSLMQRYADFRTVTAEALDYALTVLDLDGRNGLAERLMALYDRLEAYPEVPAVLDALRARGVRTAILSNGSPAMLASAVSHAGLGGRLDAVLSVDALRIFKPAPQVYALACDHFGLPPSAIAFFSSNAWDAAGAAAYGLRVVWVNRFAQPAERLPAQAEAIIPDLSSVPDLIVP